LIGVDGGGARDGSVGSSGGIGPGLLGLMPS
jgi:hypothetical protein